MSSLNLNLLPSQARFQAAKIKAEKKVKLVLTIIVSLWLLVVGIVFTINIVFKVKVNIVQAQFDKAKNDYMSMSDDIITSQRLKYKAKLVGGVLEDRFEYGMAFGKINNLFPSEIIMNDFELKDRGTFILKGETSGRANVDSLEKIIFNINSGKNEDFNVAKLSSLSLADNIWTFDMEVKMR